jgi:homoserine kinase type II
MILPKQAVYILFHTNPDSGSEKLIGVYSTKDKASTVIQKYRSIPGFRDYPDGYIVDEYGLDQDNWEEGFG